MDDFFTLRLTARATYSDVARLCGVTTRTVKLWERTQAPIYAISLLKMLAGFPDGWDGWRFSNGLLWTPEGTSYNAGTIRAIPYLMAQLQEFRRKQPGSFTDPDYSNVVPFPGKDLRR